MKRAEYAIVAIIVALALAGLSLTVGPARAQTALPTRPPETGQAAPGTIAVSGHGEVDVQPDEAVVQIGVQTDAETASSALQGNSQAMQKALDAIRSAGVVAQDIQTQQVQLQARYSNPGQQGGTPTLAGYTATNTVSVRVRDLSKLGSLLDAAVGAGGNRIDGIQFVVSDMAKSAAQARAAAWNDALTKAQQLAGLAGVSLGQPVSISEGGQGSVPIAVSGVAAPQAAAVPIQPGTETVSADLQVTWALGPGTGPLPAGQPSASGTPMPTAPGILITPSGTASAPSLAPATLVPLGTGTPAPLSTSNP